MATIILEAPATRRFMVEIRETGPDDTVVTTRTDCGDDLWAAARTFKTAWLNRRDTPELIDVTLHDGKGGGVRGTRETQRVVSFP